MAVHLSWICFEGFVNPGWPGKLVLPQLCCCFCNMGERTWHVKRHFKSSFSGRAAGSLGRAISPARAEMLIAHFGTTWLRQVLVCSSKSEERKRGVLDDTPGWLHGEMLMGMGNSGPSFPLLSCMIRKPTAKKVGFEMPTSGCCGSKALTVDCLRGWACEQCT